MTCVFSVISDQLTEPALESLLVVIRGEDGDGEGDDDEEEEGDDEEDDSENEEENGEKEDNSEVDEEDEDDEDSEPEEEEKVGNTDLNFVCCYCSKATNYVYSVVKPVLFSVVDPY